MGGHVEKRILNHQHARKIPKGFSWIDRRFVGEGWIDRLERDAILLYLFLICVADKDGLSFWSEPRTCGLLKISSDSLQNSRNQLLRLGLIAYEAPLYQVLDLGSREQRRGEEAARGEARSLTEALAERLARRRRES